MDRLVQSQLKTVLETRAPGPAIRLDPPHGVAISPQRVIRPKLLTGEARVEIPRAHRYKELGFDCWLHRTQHFAQVYIGQF